MRVEQEPDVLASRTITIVGAATIAITILLSLWAYVLLRRDERAIRPSQFFPERALPEPTEVSGIEQQAFGTPAQGAQTVQEARRRLESYGWADRERQTVHVPISRAIDLYVKQQQAAGETER